MVDSLHSLKNVAFRKERISDVAWAACVVLDDEIVQIAATTF